MCSLLIVAVRIHSDMRWEDYKDWVSMVAEERKEKINRMRLDVDRLRSLISELIARKYISETTGRSFDSIEFRRNSYGKPYVELDEPVSFNWSHAGDWILFAMDREPVGVDVEVIHHRKELDLARRFFDPQEVVQLETMNSLDRTQHFYRLWSLKESYIKWKGTGLSTLLDSFRFLYNQEQQLLFSSNFNDSCFFQTIQLDLRHYAAVCTSRECNEKPIVKIFEVDKFLKVIKYESLHI